MSNFKVIRGGSWLFGKKPLWGAHCLGHHAELMGDALGFRVVPSFSLIIRGGSLRDPVWRMTTMTHSMSSHINSNYLTGFRVVCDA